MSDDERALVTAIQTAPDENTARLAYADWLDENGTTDQQKARSEWIRLTCYDRGKRTQMPTGRQVRKAGEPAWLRVNANRLWPSLMRVRAQGFREKPHIGFTLGQLEFTLPIGIRGSGGMRLEQSVVVLTAERGVATRATVSFLRAALVAPLVAADEPAVSLCFSRVPVRCFEHSAGQVVVYRRPFALRGLAGVWDALVLERGAIRKEPVKVLKAADSSWSNAQTAGLLLNAALTRWARDPTAHDTERADV